MKRGVTLAGSNQVLELDVEFTFETAGLEKPSTETQAPLDASFPRTIVEVAPTDRPLIELYVDQPESEEKAGKPLTSVDLRVFRLPGLPAAMDAYRTLERAPEWARASDQELVRTSGLPLAASFTAPIHTTGSDWEAVSYVEFPGPLDRGWYLLVRPRTGRDQQMVLQVTDVATYVTTTTTRSVLWVNDVSSGGPLAGATLWTDGGTAIATTGVEGTATPAIPAGDLFIVTAPDAGALTDTLPGRAAIVPLRVGPDEDEWGCWGDESNDDFWTILATDRRLFRPTDEVDALGDGPSP